ncbi:hypothetical protein, partial [Maribacter caenipelagi]|uniref:hypothetical protein n=1 Tax=Maribacter caenipelagi TaxID=1447781 RepID=UPI001414EF27
NISSLDTDTQYTAGTGLNLVGTEFSADPSLATDIELSDAITASEALDLDKVIGNETITGLAFDGAVLTISEGGNTDQTINISSLDTDTQYTAGTGLNLVGTEFSADPSLATDTELSDAITASEALDLDKVIGNESVTGLTFDGGTSILTLTQDGAANETVNLGALDTDTQYTAGTGLNLVGTEFSVAPNGITNTELADNAVQSSNILNDAVTLSKLADGNALGQVMQWDGTDWTLVDLGSVTVTENDGVIGNEVVGVTGGNSTLTRSGDGSQAVPYTLAVAADGITNNELADDAVGLENITAGSASGDLIQWNGTDWEFVTASSLDTDTQYTAGTGLNLVGTEFSADPSLATD